MIADHDSTSTSLVVGEVQVSVGRPRYEGDLMRKMCVLTLAYRGKRRDFRSGLNASEERARARPGCADMISETRNLDDCGQS